MPKGHSFWKILSGVIAATAALVGVAAFGYQMGKDTGHDTPTPPNSKSISYLRNFSEVLGKAADILELANDEIWVAVDVAAYGCLKQPSIYKKYKTALMHAASKASNINVLWFSEDLEKRYFKDLAELSTAETHEALKEGKIIRDCFERAVKADLFVLGSNNFWLSKDKNNKYHVIVTWFALQAPAGSELIGFYIQSDKMAQMLKKVWTMWAKQNNEGFSKKFAKIVVP